MAKTPQERRIGLMGRNSLPSDRGMLFQYSSAANRSFWMKNTNIPLDILFLQGGLVGSFYSNVQPCKKDPCPSCQ